jgi:hypothetical protein
MKRISFFSDSMPAMAVGLALGVGACASSGGAAKSDGSGAVAAEAKPAEARPQVGKIGMVFHGDLGLLVSIVSVGKPEDNEVLLKYDGIDHPWVGKVWKARKINAGSGYDYVVTYEGSDYHTVIQRGGEWGGQLMEAYLPNRKPEGAHVAYDEAASKAFDPQKLLTEYLAQKP